MTKLTFVLSGSRKKNLVSEVYKIRIKKKKKIKWMYLNKSFIFKLAINQMIPPHHFSLRCALLALPLSLQ